MSVQVENLEKNMAKLTIEVSAEDLEKALESAYQKQKKQISVPGFRKGKVPRAMIEKMYGVDVFYEDAANALIPDAYDKALEECEEQIVSSPKIDVTQLEAGKPFIFTAEVALKPEVTLGKYKGVKVDKIDVKVSDEDIDAEINRERESNARTISVEDRAVKDGDMTVIDFEGFVDGVAFEGGKGENYPLTIGSGSFIPGFEEALVGAELNKETEVNVTFPEDYHATELAGKPAVFKCTVKEIKEKQLPDLDDEFAQGLGLAVVGQLDHQVLHGAAGVGHLVGDHDGIGMDALDVGEVDALHDALDTVEYGVERAAHQVQILALERGDKGREQGVLKLMVLLVGRMLDCVHLVEHIVNLRGIEVLENLGEQLGSLDGKVGARDIVVKVERIGFLCHEWVLSRRRRMGEVLRSGWTFGLTR